MRNKRAYLLIAAASLTAFVLASVPANGANYLKDISVQKAGDSAVVIITTSQPCQYDTLLISGRPQRIVIDLGGVTNAWTNRKFSTLPFKSIQSIRTSQFEREPLVTRVVLDIDRAIGFVTDQRDNDIVIKFPVAPGETEFAEWRAQRAPVTPVAAKKKTTTPPATTASKPATTSKPAPARVTSSGVKLESYPKRKKVAYGTGSLHDPFMPLVGGSLGKMSTELPQIENLTLVGILTDVEGNRALLEDAEGNGYILLPNDKVKHGYLVTVTDTKAIFQITEYGWTRTVALELDLPELR